VFNKVVRWDEWGEVENVYLVYNFSYSVIYLTKIIKIDGHLTKLWHKQFVQFFRHGIYIYIFLSKSGDEDEDHADGKD